MYTGYTADYPKASPAFDTGEGGKRMRKKKQKFARGQAIKQKNPELVGVEGGGHPWML